MTSAERDDRLQEGAEPAAEANGELDGDEDASISTYPLTEAAEAGIEKVAKRTLALEQQIDQHLKEFDAMLATLRENYHSKLAAVKHDVKAQAGDVLLRWISASDRTQAIRHKSASCRQLLQHCASMLSMPPDVVPGRQHHTTERN